MMPGTSTTGARHHFIGEQNMRRLVSAALIAAMVPVALSSPAMAQSPSDQARWDSAQSRYQAETERYYAERDRYYDSRRAWRAPPPPPPPPPPAYNDDRFATNYDAYRDYREGPGYQERVLSSNDQVYRGSDGRYYCKRNDGTTGLILGAAGGGILGNVIDGGRNRVAGTLIGGALGALAGKAIEQNNQQVRCR
jgi:Ni/Co efflux regulator RcnB